MYMYRYNLILFIKTIYLYYVCYYYTKSRVCHPVYLRLPADVWALGCVLCMCFKEFLHPFVFKTGETVL